MPSLKGRSPNSAYQELLKISNEGAGLDGSLRNIEDGSGNPTGIQIGTGMVAIFGYQFPSSGFASGKVLRVNADNSAFEWHTISASDIPNLSSVATSGHYSDLSGLPTIPTSLSQLTNDLNLITQTALQTYLTANYGSGQYVLPTASATVSGGVKIGSGLTITTGTLAANVTTVAGRTGAVTLSTTDISGINSYALTSAVPTKVSQLTNDSGFLTSVPVSSVAGRTGAITLSTTDISGIGSYATIASPTFTGVPAAPTATAGTNTTQLATTAFVTSAVSTASAAIPTKTSQLTNDAGFVTASTSPVVSVAGRTGAIALVVSDVSGAAPLANPALTGSPTAPTATAGTNSTQIATTAFVQSALPTKTSQLTNDSNFVSSGALATVATSGNYNDLANLPIYNFDGGDANTNALFYQIVVVDGGTS